MSEILKLIIQIYNLYVLLAVSQVKGQINSIAYNQVEIYNRLGTVPVPSKDLQYWRGTLKGDLAGSCPSVLARY